MTMTRLNFALAKQELAIPVSGDIAVLRAVTAPDCPEISKARLRLFNSFRPVHDRLLDQGYNVASELDGQYPATIVSITRSKSETLGLFAQALVATDPGGLVIVDGTKTDGIDSLLKRVKSVFELAGSVAKFHGKLFWLHRPKTLPDVVADWRAAAAVSENPAGFQTAPGMFSADKIDKGSALLATHFNDNLAGDVADLGAGWGWLSHQALTKGGAARIDLFEAENLALEAAKVNVEEARAGFFWADVLTMAARADYDTIISNPPFHQGRAADPAIGAGFIAKAAQMLRPRGCFWLVANRQLPYERHLEEAFRHWETIEQTPYFKVLRGEKPRNSSSRNRRSFPVK